MMILLSIRRALYVYIDIVHMCWDKTDAGSRAMQACMLIYLTFHVLALPKYLI